MAHPRKELTHAALFFRCRNRTNRHWIAGTFVTEISVDPRGSFRSRLLLRHPALCAERDMPGLIRAYNEATGVAKTDSSGYHETLRAARACPDLLWRATVASHDQGAQK